MAGLLVGAVTNQRPELFAAAVPAVGVMDMLRFTTVFTIGLAWASDYGTSDNGASSALQAYSPLHNIRSGVNYPAVLITTADRRPRGAGPFRVRRRRAAGGRHRPAPKLISHRDPGGPRRRQSPRPRSSKSGAMCWPSSPTR